MSDPQSVRWNVPQRITRLDRQADRNPTTATASAPKRASAVDDEGVPDRRLKDALDPQVADIGGPNRSNRLTRRSPPGE